VCLGVVAVAVAWTLPSMAHAERDARLRGAARALTTAAHLARTEAARRATSVAVQFSEDGEPSAFGLVIDGNGNGVRRAEIVAGTDAVMMAVRRVGDEFRGVRFGIASPCPGIDGGDPVAPGDPPVRFGTSRLMVFTPDGTASSGTAYLAGETDETFAVRVFGATGRTRVFRCSSRVGTWVEE
jgi:hypothetical protein